MGGMGEKSRAGVGVWPDSLSSRLIRARNLGPVRTLEARMQGTDGPFACQTLTTLECRQSGHLLEGRI